MPGLPSTTARRPALREAQDALERPLAAQPPAATLRRLHERMRLLREFDERCATGHRQGRVGPAPRIYGHEAMQAGAFEALEDRDWIFPTYRETAIAAFRGMPLWTPYAQWRGHPSGWWNPADYRVAAASIAVGTHLPHAAGLAWGMRLRRSDACALAFVGDGATSEGSFHEGMTFAGAMALPLVVLCNNNGWAISTPVHRQTGAAKLVDKAIGYGMPGVRIDGTDPVAVYAAVGDALARARAGAGPTFIEAVSYRIPAHGTADDDSLYRSLERSEAEIGNECLGRYEGWLLELGVASAEELEAVRAACFEQARSALIDAEALGEPDPAAVFDTTYSGGVDVRQSAGELQAP
jgi:pyruvate dehydrogenase E1 component alpha subunit